MTIPASAVAPKNPGKNHRTVVLISTYELGRQPFGLASPAAQLAAAGADVFTLDLSIQGLDEDLIRAADLIGFYLPMHTATRLAAPVASRVRELNTTAHLAFYGLYAAPNADFLRRIGAQTIISGEFEQQLVAAYHRLDSGGNGRPTANVITDRIDFILPERHQLPSLTSYARLIDSQGQAKVVGYTEASRGCKHLCRHCPVVPVYGGKFRIVPIDLVLQDIQQQVDAGAQHLTFGDPDFFNGIGHAIPLVEELHRRFPDLTYDVTIKVEHLLHHARHLNTLRQTGCLLITSAVESFQSDILQRLDKGHTPQDFEDALSLVRQAGLALNPTFIPFHPWTTPESYLAFLNKIEEDDLIYNVAPVQFSIRLLITAGSGLLDLEEIQSLIEPFDPEALAYPWRHVDPRVDRLHAAVMEVIEAQGGQSRSRPLIFQQVRTLAEEYAGHAMGDTRVNTNPLISKPIPYLTEDWYC